MVCRASLALLLTTGFAFAAAGPASAAFDAPTTVPGSSTPDLAIPTGTPFPFRLPGLSAPSIAITGSGDAVIAWHEQAQAAQPATRTRRTPAGRYGPLLGANNLATPIVTYAKTRVATLRSFVSSERTRLVATLGSVTSAKASERTLVRDAVIPEAPVLAGDHAGDLAAVWVQAVGDHDHLRLSLRHPGAEFGSAHTVRGSGTLSSPAVAYGDRGDILVAYQRAYRDGHGRLRHRIEARLRRPGHGFGSVRVLGPSRGGVQIVSVIAPTGRAYVLWSEADGGEEVNEPTNVYTTEAAPSRFTFNKATRLARSPASGAPEGAPRLVVDRAGDATGAFSLPRGDSHDSIQTASARSGEHFGTPRTLVTDEKLEDLAGRADGADLAVWTDPFAQTSPPRRVHAAFRASAAASFGAAEDVSPAPDNPGSAAAAFGSDGHPLVAWIGRPGFTGASPPQPPSAMRVARRR